MKFGGRFFNYELAAKLLQHSLEENAKEFLITDEQIINTIKKDEKFQEKMNEIINKHKKEKEFYIPLGQEAITFENSDLYFAIHIAKIEMKAQKNDESSWNVAIKLSDTFDFTKWKWMMDYYYDANSIPKSILSSTLYNLAFISQKLGVIKEYEVAVKFSFKMEQGIIK